MHGPHPHSPTFGNVHLFYLLTIEKNKLKYGPESYRPIMITPVLGKVMEKRIYHQLLWFVEKNNMIPCTQTGFRKHQSSTDAFILLTNGINESYPKMIS